MSAATESPTASLTFGPFHVALMKGPAGYARAQMLRRVGGEYRALFAASGTRIRVVRWGGQDGKHQHVLLIDDASIDLPPTAAQQAAAFFGVEIEGRQL